MCVDRSICCDLGVPVEESIAIGAGIPSVKSVAGFSRSTGVSSLVILRDDLVFVGGTAVGVETHRKGWRVPLGVEHQRNTAVRGTSRHLTEGVRCTFATSIIVPTTPRVIAIHTTLCLSGRPVVSVACYSGIILNI